MNSFNITGQEIAEALGITLEHLSSACDSFSSDSDSRQKFTQGVHFEWGLYGSRFFSEKGVIEICRFLETDRNAQPFYHRWKAWFSKREQQSKGLMIARKVQEVSTLPGQLKIVNGKAFLGLCLTHKS